MSELEEFLTTERNMILSSISRQETYRSYTSENIKTCHSRPQANMQDMQISNTQTSYMEIEKENIVNIGTHNIRGITRITDQNNLLEEIKEWHIDILGLSETKLTTSTAKWAFKQDNEYKFFSSCNDNHPYRSGVEILIKKEQEKRLGSIDRIEGHVICANFITTKSKVAIIQIYLPNDKQYSRHIQKGLRKLIQEKQRSKSKIILMGDFNAVTNPATDRLHIPQFFRPYWIPEIPLFKFLEDWNLIDVQKKWKNNNHPSPT